VLEVFQDDCRDFLWRVIAPGEMDFVVSSHPALDRFDGPFGIQDELVARVLADEQLAGFPTPTTEGGSSARVHP
jgi:hypothetical protein